MWPFIDTKRCELVEAETRATYQALFPAGNPLFVGEAFRWAVDCFEGRREGYLPIDVQYHDLEHTLQGVLCISRMLLRRGELKIEPGVDQRHFELGLLAMLFHDAGYLKKRGDFTGTGAKYTLIHVDRSADFAAAFLEGHHFLAHEIRAVQNMIRCTGLGVKLDAIDFQNPIERVVGCALGTADLLGQMAAPDYVDKLPILYLEFAETARYTGKASAAGAFLSAEDLMRKTPAFWEKFVLPKLDGEFGGVVRVLSDPYPGGPNDYIDRVNANIARLRSQFPES